jgi:hypothetical protein
MPIAYGLRPPAIGHTAQKSGQFEKSLTGRPKTIQEHIARHNAERNTLFCKEFMRCHMKQT